MSRSFPEYLQSVVYMLGHTSPIIFLYLIALIAVISLRKKLHFSKKLIAALIIIVIIDVVFPFVWQYLLMIMMRGDYGNLHSFPVILGTIRTVIYTVLIGIVFYELIIGRFKLLPSPESNQGSINKTMQLGFAGSASEALKYLFLIIISSLLIIPMAWAIAATNRWVVRSVSVDGKPANATFNGKGTEIWPYFIGISLLSSIIYLTPALAGILPREYHYIGQSVMLLSFVLFFLLLPLTIYWGFVILKWSVRSIQAEKGLSPSFEGNYVSFISYYIGTILAYVSVIGWAWVIASFLRWICRGIQVKGYNIRFTGKGHQILGVYLAFSLGSLFIITIPFLTVWIYKWHMEKIEIDIFEETVEI